MAVIFNPFTGQLLLVPNSGSSSVGIGTTPITGGTDNTILVNDNNFVSSVGPLANGQLLIGSSGNLPVPANLTQGTGMTITNAAGQITVALSSTVQSDIDSKIPLSQKGAANGVVPLDGSSKISAAYLPNSVMELQGFWNASTNTPTLADGSGNPGDVWEVSVAGTTDFGSGPISFNLGDWAVYAADAKWHKSVNSNEVTSVNGLTGPVVLTTTNINEGTNLYFTDERAQDSVGNILADTSTINFTYNDAGNTITADVIENALNLNNQSGILNIAHGGTNSNTALSNNRVIISSSGSIVEHTVLNSAQIIFTDSNGLPQVSPNMSYDNTLGKVSLVTSQANESLYLRDDSGTNTNVAQIIEKNSTVNAAGSMLFRRSRGTFASPTAVQSGDALLSIAGVGHNGTSYAAASSCRALIISTETHTPTAKGARWAFATTPNTTLNRKDRFYIDQDGALVLIGDVSSGQLKLYPHASSSTYSITYPQNQGASNTTLINNGSGALTWSSVPVASSGDINETEAFPNQGENTPVDVAGLAFSASIRSFKAMVSIEIDATADLYEVTELVGINKNGTWEIAQGLSVGDNTDFVFSITNAGQVQYTSGTYTGYSGAKIKFRAITTTV